MEAEFTKLFDSFYRRLTCFATNIIKDKKAAEDLVSDVFTKLWIKRIRFETYRKARSWLYKCTKNACFNYLKRIKDQWIKSYPHTHATHETALTSIIKRELRRDILIMLEKLPPECSRILKMSYVDELTNQEIAKKLSLSVHTVKNQKARAAYLIVKKLKLKRRNFEI